MRKYNSYFITAMAAWMMLMAAGHAQGESGGKKPVSVSLSECSAVYILLEEIGQTRNKDPETLNRLGKAANAFLSAAYEQAQKEGRDTPRQFIDNNVKRFIPLWNDKMVTGDSLDHTKELMQYCRALGTQKNILPLQ